MDVLNSSSSDYDSTCEMSARETQRRHGAYNFYWGLLIKASLPSMCKYSTLPEGKQVFNIDHVVCTNNSYQGVGNPLNIQVLRHHLIENLLTGFSKDIAVRSAMFSFLQISLIWFAIILFRILASILAYIFLSQKILVRCCNKLCYLHNID